MFVSESRVACRNPGVCLAKLCRHWSHRFSVSFDDVRGEIDFIPARCILWVDGATLRVRLETPQMGELEELEPIVAEHLQRMLRDEIVRVDWQR